MLEAFEDSDFVISPSGSCTGMIHHYPKLFEDDPYQLEKANRLQTKHMNSRSFSCRCLGVTDVGAIFPHKVTYHPSCHGSRLLGVKDEPMQLMEHVQGLGACAASFCRGLLRIRRNFRGENVRYFRRDGDEKADHVLETEAEVLVGLDMACLMNIAGNLRYRDKPVRSCIWRSCYMKG